MVDVGGHVTDRRKLLTSVIRYIVLGDFKIWGDAVIQEKTGRRQKGN